jgi:two-component system, OmpR family, phosphate regulon response regulator PhoB
MGGAIHDVEDEPAIQELIAVNLEHAGHRVLRAGNVAEAEAMVRKALPDVVLLDWMLPGTPGLDFARRLRADRRTRDIPIIMLTAKAQENDKVAGLEGGVDDYVTKPFSPRELLARVKAILRRSEPAPRENMLALGDVTVDVEGREGSVEGRQVELTAKEFDLLTYFAESPGVVHSRDRLLDRVWGMSYPGGTRTVDVHVGQLRRKLGRPELIRTVRGAGYKAVSP